MARNAETSESLSGVAAGSECKTSHCFGSELRRPRFDAHWRQWLVGLDEHVVQHPSQRMHSVLHHQVIASLVEHQRRDRQDTEELLDNGKQLRRIWAGGRLRLRHRGVEPVAVEDDPAVTMWGLGERADTFCDDVEPLTADCAQ